LKLALIITALLFALYWPQPKCLARYLWAQLTYALVIFPVNYFWGDGSLAYAMVYVLFTGIILATVMGIAWEALGTNWQALGAMFVVCLTIEHYAIAGLGHAPRWYDWIGITEGVILFGAAMIVGWTAPRMKLWDVSLTLAFLWFGQALFRWGFYLHLPDKLWLTLNWIVPAWLGIVAFTIVGWRGRAHLRRLRSRYS
jgi:hypothetical protein